MLAQTFRMIRLGLLGSGRASRFRGWMTFLLVALGPILAALTLYFFSAENQDIVSPTLLRSVYLADLCYVIVLAALVCWRLGGLIMARRAQSAGSRLHLRLAGVFMIVALAPTILVAVFATVTVSNSLEGWFSNRIGSVVRNSLSTAEAYGAEHRRAIRRDVLAMANDLNRAGAAGIDDGNLGELVRAQARFREIPEAYVFDSNQELRARGEFSYLFNFEAPTAEELDRARRGEVVLIEDSANDEIRALVYLRGFINYYLLVSRDIDGNVLELLDNTRETVKLYDRLEKDRGQLLLNFSLMYLGFALLVLLASLLGGLLFADKLANPIGRLAWAARRFGDGDFNVQVRESAGDDEIAVLGRTFNYMTRQVRHQHDALRLEHRKSEHGRQFMETVLSGVTAGVVRIDRRGRIEMINDAACEQLRVIKQEITGAPLDDVAPLFVNVLAEATKSSSYAEDRVRGVIAGRERDFLVRVTRLRGAGDTQQGYVVTFDDMTQLVSAQRLAAWGDIARRIAHEIKNPLTPIQLSAERLKRKFGKQVDEGRDRERFDQYADMIVRQAGDIRRIVDEFSKFARMPSPEPEAVDVKEVLDDTVLLQNTGFKTVKYSMEAIGAKRKIELDRGLVTQAMTNILKNAGEAVEARQEDEPNLEGSVHVILERNEHEEFIRVIDNGIGLPETGREKLFEPYVTRRAKGTGLGLAITRKIIEEHGGSFILADAPEGKGAMAEIRLPVAIGDREDDAEDVDVEPLGESGGNSENVPTANSVEKAALIDALSKAGTSHSLQRSQETSNAAGDASSELKNDASAVTGAASDKEKKHG